MIKNVQTKIHTLSTTPWIISSESSREGVFKWVLQHRSRTFHLSLADFSSESWSPGRLGLEERISWQRTCPSCRSVVRFVTRLVEVESQTEMIWSILKDSHPSSWNLGWSSHLKYKNYIFFNIKSIFSLL